MSQPRPPPSVRPAIPVVETRPPVVARPKACVSRSNSPQVTPASAWTALPCRSTRTLFIGDRSIIRPPSQTALPETLWPPPRTDTNRPLFRAKFTAAITSALSTTWRPVIAAISIFAMSAPSLTFGTLHQTGTALPSRIFTRNVAGLFDHLVGDLLESQGDVEAEPLGSFEIDDQFELGWSLHRQVGRLLAPEDAGRAVRASRLRIRRLKTSTYWLERVFDHVGRDLWAHVLAGADRESIVNAAPDADILLLLSHIGQAGELPRPLRIPHIGRRERNDLQGTEYRFQNRRRDRCVDGRLRGVFGMQRRRDKRGPAGIALGCIIPVLVAIADRGDGPPEFVEVLGVPIDDVGVRQAHVEQREQAGTFGERHFLLDRELARRRLPRGTEIDVVPELRRLGLLRSTRGAVGAPEALHLVVVAGPLRARQCRRRAGPELVGALDHPWLRARILLP